MLWLLVLCAKPADVRADGISVEAFHDRTAPYLTTIAGVAAGNAGLSSFAGGGLGYDWYTDRFVFGLEAIVLHDSDKGFLGNMQAKAGINFGCVVPFATFGSAFVDSSEVTWSAGAGLELIVSDTFSVYSHLQLDGLERGSDAKLVLGGKYRVGPRPQKPWPPRPILPPLPSAC